MPDYYNALRQLDAAVADAVDDLLVIREKLTRAQQKADDIIIESPEPEVVVLPGGKDEPPGPSPDAPGPDDQ